MLVGRRTCHKRNAFLFNLKDEKVHMSEGISLFLLEMCTEECMNNMNLNTVADLDGNVRVFLISLLF